MDKTADELEQTHEPQFYIQVGGTPGATLTRESVANDLIAGSREHFEKVAQVIEAAGRSFVDRLNNVSAKPSECSIEFGINAGGEAGVPFVTNINSGGILTICHATFL